MTNQKHNNLDSYQIIDVTNCKTNGLSEYSQEIQNAYKVYAAKRQNRVTIADYHKNKLWLVLDNNLVGFISAMIYQLLPFHDNVYYLCNYSDMDLIHVAIPLIEAYIENNYDSDCIRPQYLPSLILEQYGYTHSGGWSYSKSINRIK